MEDNEERDNQTKNVKQWWNVKQNSEKCQTLKYNAKTEATSYYFLYQLMIWGLYNHHGH